MRLYHRWKCPWCAAARQAIENVGAEVELVEVPYPRDERVEVREISGQSKVPVLVDNDANLAAKDNAVLALVRSIQVVAAQPSKKQKKAPA